MVQSRPTKKLRKQSIQNTVSQGRPITLTTNAKLENINKDQFLQSVDDNVTRRLCQKEDESSSEFLPDLGRDFFVKNRCRC